MRLTILALSLLILTVPVLAEEPGTAVVTRADFAETIPAEGRVSPGAAVEVRLSPKDYSGRYTILTVLEAGTTVAQGDVVMTFDAEKTVEALADARFELAVAEAGYATQMGRLTLGARAVEEDLKAKRRDVYIAERNLEAYVEFNLVESARRAEDDELGQARSVENAKDELEQLEMMYEEDELVDETEEIVLKRARWDLENRLKRQAQRKRQRAHDIEYGEKERVVALTLAVEQKKFALERAMFEAERAALSREHDAERATRSIEKRRKQVADLENDLEGFIQRAPQAGILLHGDLKGCVDRNFKRGDQLSAESVAFVIAAPDALELALSVPSSDTMRVAVGQGVAFTVTAAGAVESTAVVLSRGILPEGGRARFVATPAEAIDPGLLGLATKARLTFNVLKEALTLPLAAVREEKGVSYCLVPGPEDAPVRVEVTVGPKDAERVVILDGLKEGAVVLLGEQAE
jgi:hypothetical protein